jgi:di/tricarboxylate transporter
MATPLAPPPTATAVAAGCAVYAGVWLALLRDEWPALPLGRAVSATLGAGLLVGAGVLSPAAAFAAVNLETLALLTGCMLVSAHLERQGAYAALAGVLAREGAPATALLLRVSAASAVASALITNDAAALVLTPLVLAACRARRFHPAPHLLAVATCANIGSAASPIGNPQNMLVATLSGLSFVQFVWYIGLAAVVGTGVNVAVIAWAYRAQLAPGASFDFGSSGGGDGSGGDGDGGGG